MIIVSDASPLIGLSQIGGLRLLNQLFKKIVIPPMVAFECTEHSHKPGAKIIQKAIDKSEITVYQDSFETVKNLSALLGPGEIEAISLAKKLSAPLLIDERLGRNAADQLKIAVIGTCGLLLLAKQQKIIPDIKSVMNQLINTGYRISQELEHAALKIAKEK